MRRPSRSWLTVAGAAIAALFLTILRPSPEGLVGLGVGNRSVRAAPGQAASVVKKHNLAALEVINWTLIHVQDGYVDPKRIDPKDMFFAALDSVQYNIPEVLIKPDRDANQVVVQVNDKRQSFSTSDIDSPWRLSKTLKRVFRFMEANMNPGADLAEVEYAAANGILGTLDPHSTLLDPEQAREMSVNTGGGFSGLGIVIGMRNKRLSVIRPMPNTPASRAGILAKDAIVRINDEVTENLTLTEAVNRMRGKKGSALTIWIEREGEDKPLQFNLIRDRISVASVEHKLLSNKVGYIKIKQFSSPTAKETRDALNKLTDSGATSFVLDLRSNPGGLLEQAIRVSDIFVDRGTIVTTVSGKERETHRAERAQTISRAPLAVLINGNSASASEIVAGALKNLDRSIIIGDTSFGKGSVQILYDNKDGSTLKLTIAQYLTPGDLSIQGLGITPDIALRRMYVPKKNEGPKDYLQILAPSKRYRERDLKSSLRSKYAKEGDKPRGSLSFVYESPKKKKSGTESDEEKVEQALLDSDEIVEDYEMRFAKEYISQYGAATRTASLKNLSQALRTRQETETQRLHDKMQNLGVDWSAAPANHPASDMRVSFELEDGGHTINAGDVAKLKTTVTNVGNAVIYRAQARIAAANPAFRDKEMLFGKIAPGESKTWSSQVKVGASALDRLEYLRLNLLDAAKSTGSAKPLKLRIVAAQRPVFAYSHQLIDNSNGDGLVQNSESHTLRITVANTGKASATDVVAVLRNASGTDLMLKKARFDLDTLKPGESKSVDFEFDTAKQTKDLVVVELQVYEGTYGENIAEKLKYPVRAASSGPQKSKGNVRINEGAAIYEGAADDSAIIARAKQNAVLKVNAHSGSWIRVDTGERRPGFVKASDAKKVSARPNTNSLKRIMQVTPPELELTIPSYESKSDTYTLEGKISDDTKVEDVYIFVSNRDAKIDGRKVFYRSNRNGATPTQMQFRSEIPLWPGSNVVTVVARENNEVRTVRTLFLNRTSSEVSTR